MALGLFGLLVGAPAVFVTLPAGTIPGLLLAGTVVTAEPASQVAEGAPDGVAVAADATGIETIVTVKDKVCACESLDCVAGLHAEIQVAGKAMFADPQAAAQHAQRLQKLTQEMAECIRELASKPQP